MAGTIKQRLRRYNGTDYDTVHLETDGSVVEVEVSGETMDLNSTIGDINEKVVNVDDIPVRNSRKFVTSGGVFDAIDGISGGESGAITPTEFDDLTIHCGVLTNEGPGWNRYNFTTSFDDIPVVTLQPVGFNGWIEIKDVDVDGFSYRLQRNRYTAGSVVNGSVTAGTVIDGEVTSGNFYTGVSTGSNPQHTQQTLVKTVTLPEVKLPTVVLPVIELPTTTVVDVSDNVTIFWIAMEYNGEG